MYLKHNTALANLPSFWRFSLVAGNGNDEGFVGGSSLLRHEQFTGVVCVSGGLTACETGGIKVLSDSKGADSSTSGLISY